MLNSPYDCKKPTNTNATAVNSIIGNNIFIKSTIILILGGIVTKILGFIIRIIYTRIVGPEVIGLYSLVMPTYSLLITIATLALPTTISKLIAENKHNNLRINQWFL